MIQPQDWLDLVPKQSCQHLVSWSTYSRIYENPSDDAWILWLWNVYFRAILLSGRKKNSHKPIQHNLLTAKLIYASILINRWNSNLQHMSLLKFIPCLKIRGNTCGNTHLEISKPQTFIVRYLMNSNTAVYTFTNCIWHFPSKTANTFSYYQPTYDDTILIKKYLCSSREYL